MAQVTTTHYIGNVEVITRPNGDKETKRYINGVVIDTQTKKANGSTTGSVQLLLKDHLGSIHTIMDGNKMTVLQRQSFDPFGQRRNPTDWQALLEKDRLGFDSKLTTRGFTGHEQLDEVGLVHMNGRVYDPRLGRFLQADPFIQAASNTQSFNRYSYVQNNPLNAVDPSGYFLGKLFKGIGKLLGGFAPFVAIAAAIFLPGAGFMIAAFGKFGAAVAAGFISGGIATGSLKGAFVGAFSAGMFYGIGEAFKAGGWAKEMFGAASRGAKIAAHGMAGGVMSVLNGGKFGNGFVGAGLTQWMSPAIGVFETPTAQVFAAAVVGGTSSELTGGKFANGAMTGAFSQAFNELMHDDNPGVSEYPYDDDPGIERVTVVDWVIAGPEVLALKIVGGVKAAFAAGPVVGKLGRKGAFRQAKKDLKISRSQHPLSVDNNVRLTDRNGNNILGSDGLPIRTREYTFNHGDGGKVVIQDHSAGHYFGQGGRGDQSSHFNVRPIENTRTGNVAGTLDHYPFGD